MMPPSVKLGVVLLFLTYLGAPTYGQVLSCGFEPDPLGAFLSAVYSYTCSFDGSDTPMCSIDEGPMVPCPLEGEIDVFDFPPGPHTAAITVGNMTQEFPFTTPEIELRCAVNPDPVILAAIYMYNCSIISGSGTPECTIDDQVVACNIDGDVNVFDFPPGSHIVAITIRDGNLTSNTESFTFTTPGILIITTQPRDVLTRSGEMAQFECEAIGSANITYQWQKLNDTIDLLGGGGSGSGDGMSNYVNVENAIDPILEFNPVMFGDEGLYRCVVSSESVTLTSEMAALTVSPEDSVAVSPINETFNQGDNVTFTCSASGGPGNTFQWLRNGTELVNEISETFIIFGVAFIDGDEYTCMVSNAAGSESASTFPFVRPEIILNPMHMTTSNGSFIVIMCDAEAFPPPEFQWVHIGGDIGSNIVGQDTNMLVFSLVSFGDEGDYFCTATSNGISVMSDNATITVSPEGSVEASPPVINAERNTLQTFTCTALGGPGNTFTWLSDAQTVSADPELQIFVMDASVGSQYECLVENEAGNETATVTLNVAVAIDASPVATNVTTTEEYFLTCTASGYPVPVISWTHNGTDIDENDNRITITASNGLRYFMSTLTVSGAMTNDSGEYACNATNTFNTAIGDPVIVLVQDTPEQPQNVTGRALNSTTIQLTWFEPHDNNAPILGYRVMYIRPEFLNGIDVELNVTSEMAVVTGLHPGVTYNFTVVAFNEIGDSRETAVAMVTTEDEVPSDSPQNVRATTLSSTEIQVTWEQLPPITRNGIIITYEVLYETLMTFGGSNSVNSSSGLELSLILTGLEEFVKYSITVRAYTSAGAGPFSEAVTNMTFEDEPATPPQNVQALVLSSNEIMVTWVEVAMIDHNGIITNYEVDFEPLNFPADIFDGTITTMNLSVVITNLEEFINYNISVRAFTIVGPGPYSDPVTERTLEDRPATPPQNVQAMARSSTEISVTWEEVPAIDENGVIINYEIQFEPLEFTDVLMTNTINATNLLAVITGLQEYVQYNISVRAYTSVGPGPYSDPVMQRTSEDEPATPPQNVQTTALTSTQIMVTWEEVPAIDQNGIIIIYEVQYDPRQFTGLLTTDYINTTNTSAVITGLQEYVEYNISVRAYTSVGPGPYSDPVTERTLQDRPAAPPQNVSTTTISSIAINVTWEEVPAIAENGIIINYEVEVEPLYFTDILITAYVNTTDLSTTIIGLEEYVEYSISVRAYTNIGAGPVSPPVTERTFEDGPATSPQNVQTTVLSSTAIMVTWEEVPAIDENGIIIIYEVQFEALEFIDILMTETINASSLMVTITGLQEYVQYNISVRAFTIVGPGPYSNPVTERTLEDRPATPPQNVQSMARSSTEISVTWEEVPAIDENGVIINYEIQFEPLEFTDVLMTNTINATNLSTVITGLQEYVEYDISVRAFTGVGPGPYSDSVTERTLEDRPATPPQNMQAMARSSTEISVTWEEVPAIDENGVIINYEIQFEPLEFTSVLMTNTINPTNLLTVITVLQEYVQYNISVRAYTSVGPGPYSDPVTERTLEDRPATPPQNVQANARSSTEIMVTWEEVLPINQNGIITNYEVQYEPLQFTDSLSTMFVNTTDMAVNLTNLQEYVEYTISVRAFTSVGPGPYRDPVTERTLEDFPAGFPQNVMTTTLSPTEIRINWEPMPAIEENGIITTYEILYEPQETFSGQIMSDISNTTDGSVLEMVLNGLQEFVEYNITVRAYTSIGSGPFNPTGDSSRTLEDVPIVAPDNLVVENISANEMEVSWDRPTEIDINGILRYYIIEYFIVDQSDTLLTVNVTGNVLTTVLNDLDNFTDYNVSVAAFTVNTGPSGTEVERTSENVPGEPPQNVVARTQSFITISVEWESPPQDFLFGILSGYIIRYIPGDMDGVNLTELIPPTNNSFTLENLFEFTNYSIEVTAVTGAGEGPYSPPIYVVTNQDLPGGVDLPPDVQPDDFDDAFVNGVIDVTVRWNPPRNPNGVITQYNVEFVAISTNFPAPDPPRGKRQVNPVQQECIMGGADNVNRTISVPGTQTSANLAGLTAFTTYEFRVQAETAIGLGSFSEPQSFSTPEFVPTEPRVLTVQYLSSSSLEITWNHPLCDYGIRTHYTIMHVPLLGPVGPLGEIGMPGSPFVLDEQATSLIITQLTPNTNYSIEVYASTSAGAGNSSIEVNQTDEDIPQVVTNLNIVSVDNVNPGFRNNVIVRMTWTAPSLRNGSFDYNLTYTAAQTGNFPELRRDTAQDSIIISGNMEEFMIEDALPFADYTFTIFAFNIKLNAPGAPETEANRSVAIDPTAVTNLQAIPNSFSSIRVTWSIPVFPNGPVDRYAVYYRNTSTVQEAPIRSEGYKSLIETATADDIDFDVVINDLVAFTFYAIHVQPLIGGGNGSEADLFGDIDIEISQRTNATATEQPTVDVPGPVSMILWDPRSDSSVVVSWSPPLTPNGIILEYTIILLQLNAVVDAQTVSNSTFMVEFTSSELAAGIPYSLTVFAVNTAGSGEHTTITNFTRELIPPAPRGVIVDRTSGTEIIVSWIPLTLVEARSLIQFYRVRYNPGGSSRKRQATTCFQSPCDVPSTENSVRIAGLDSTTSYSVSVAAVNGQGQEGEFSEIQTAQATTSDNTAAAIIGGVVAVVALVVIGVIVAVVLVLRYRNRRAEYIIKKHDSYESIELSGVARSGDPNIDVKENVAYSVCRHPPRGSLPSPPIVVNPLAEGMASQSQEGVYDTIPGENEPAAVDTTPIEAAYELFSPGEPCDSDQPPENSYDVISHEECP